MISVCIATYNGALYIKEQIESILSQIDENDEVIISDNLSTDNTIEIIQSFNDCRIRILQYPIPSIVKNFENALNASKGNYIFLSDQDDIWIDGKVKKMMAHLIHSDFVMSDGIIILNNSISNKKTIYEITKPSLGIIRNIYKNSFTGCCIAFNRKILNYSLPFPENIPMHDWWIGLIAMNYGSIEIIKDPLIYYRRHGMNASSLSQKSDQNFFKKFNNRINISINLFKRILNLSILK